MAELAAACFAHQLFVHEYHEHQQLPAHHAESTLRKTQGVRVLGRYPLTLSGQKSAIWVMETTPANEDA